MEVTRTLLLDAELHSPLPSPSTSNSIRSALHFNDKELNELMSTPPQRGFEERQFHTPPKYPRAAWLPFSPRSPAGSPSDLTRHSSGDYSPTPPAALSSLGAKMAASKREATSESSSALADGQYDMIDDLSEISNGDHETASIETASIGSNEHIGDDGQLTPDYEGSEEDEMVPSNTNDTAELSEPFVSLPKRSTFKREKPHELEHTKAENDLIDSYMSEDLDTPRQSLQPDVLLRPRRSACNGSNSCEYDSTLVAHNINGRYPRIMFASEPHVVAEDIESILDRVVAALQPKTSSATGSKDVGATVQHYVGLDPELNKLYTLQTIDPDGVHRAYSLIDDVPATDFPPPDIGIIYLHEANEDSAWFGDAYKALQLTRVPTLIVSGPKFSLKTFRKTKLYQSDLSSEKFITFDQFVNMDQSAVTRLVSDVLVGNEPASSSKAKWHTFNSVSRTSWFKFWLLFAVLPYILLIGLRFTRDYPRVVDLGIRRGALNDVLANLSSTSFADSIVNAEHLVQFPDHGCISTDIFGRLSISPACVQNVNYQAIIPNHMIISFPGISRFPEVISTSVYKSDGKLVRFNETPLIEGIHHIAINPEDAYGVIAFSMVTKNPVLNVTASHNFGNRMLHRKTYEDAGKDVSKAVGKEVAVIRNVAQSLTNMLSNEFSSNLLMTKNATTQLARCMARDLQIMATKAISVFETASKASNDTANALTEDFVLMQQDLVRFTKDLSHSFKSTMALVKTESKALVRSPLVKSRAQLKNFKNSFKRGKKGHSKPSGNDESLKDRVNQQPDGYPDKLLALSTNVVKPRKSTSPHASSDPGLPPDSQDLQHEFGFAMRQLGMLNRRIMKEDKKSNNNKKDKLARKEIRKLKKEARERERRLKKMREEVQRREGMA